MAILVEDVRRPPVTTADRPARERSRVGPIDGLRGIALVAVLLYHVAPGTVRGGFLGVEAFFVLSGYLLTALLLDEHRRTGRISRPAYAERHFRWRSAVPPYSMDVAALNCHRDGNRDLSIATQEYSHAFL